MNFKCSICKQELDASAFSPCNQKPVMRKRRLCRECNRAACRKYQEENKEKIAARKKKQREGTKEQQTAYAIEYHKKNREHRLKMASDWHKANRESVAERHTEWRQNNPGRCVEMVRRRDAKKMQATPSWADIEQIRWFYTEAARLTQATGIKHHVDHIYPLQGKTCCGLHVHTNLQILTAFENVSKHNKMPQNEYSW